MAYVIAQQGDVQRAFQLWNQSLELKEKIGDVQGKAATLNNMAYVIAQQGDVQHALQLWDQSLGLSEKMGDVRGRAATLASMAWAAHQQEDHGRACQLNIEAARALASVRAWPDLCTVLGNLGASQASDAQGFLAQALWLGLRVELPPSRLLNLAASLLQKIGLEAPVAPLLASAAMHLVQKRAGSRANRDELQRKAAEMLAACAAARKVEQDKVEEWLVSEGLNEPDRVLPALSLALEALVGEEDWLFDRQLFNSLSGSRD